MTFTKGHTPWNKNKGAHKNCIVCGTSYSTQDRKPTSKYCSNKCKYSDDTWSKQQAEKIRGRKGHWAGLKRPEMTGEKNWNWKGGVTSKDRLERIRFKQSMQKQIFKRDNYTCQKCNQHGGHLQVDHIKKWSEYPDLRFDVNNCRTLCMDCHYFVTYGRKIPNGVIWGHNLNRRVV